MSDSKSQQEGDGVQDQAASSPAGDTATATLLPRVTIQFCTQCKWMLRAAYFAQELLSTFSVSLGEVALQPSTGGTFIVAIQHQSDSSSSSSNPATGPSPPPSSTILWDRKVDGGFPETKELKRRVRDVIEPGRDLGHVDRHNGTPGKPAERLSLKDSLGRGPGPLIGREKLDKADGESSSTTQAAAKPGDGCEDCS